jgi:hypothetical protein
VCLKIVILSLFLLFFIVITIILILVASISVAPNIVVFIFGGAPLSLVPFVLFIPFLLPIDLWSGGVNQVHFFKCLNLLSWKRLNKFDTNVLLNLWGCNTSLWRIEEWVVWVNFGWFPILGV